MSASEPLLYTLERPETFEPVEVSAPEVIGVARRFGATHAGPPRRVSKCNPRTELYCIETSLGRLMLRSAQTGSAQQLEAQCAIARACGATGLIQPLASVDGRCVVEDRDKLWIAYAAAEGKIYDGGNLALEALLEAAWRLITRMRPLPTTGLARWAHRPGLWTETFCTLANPRRCARSLEGSGVALAPATLALLHKHASPISRLAERASELARTLEPAVVHNDLQHANIVASAGQPVFLDLEDICLESPQVAVSHCLFKILRHRVHTRSASVRETAGCLARLLDRLVSHPAWEGARGSPLDYGVLRIVSDVAEILAAWTERGDAADLYDLEKRIHNLFEILDLFGVGETWIYS